MSPRQPEEEVLLRFAQGDSSRDEAREVVAHLLHQCERCASAIEEALWPRKPAGSPPFAHGRMNRRTHLIVLRADASTPCRVRLSKG